MPLGRAFALIAARTIRHGQKLPGMNYADMELNDAIERATEQWRVKSSGSRVKTHQ